MYLQEFWKTVIERRFWVRFFGKIQLRISKSKNRFRVFLGKSTNGWWIHKIHTLGGFFRSNPNPDLWDVTIWAFFGKGFDKKYFDKQFSEQMWYLLSIYIRRLFLNPYLSCFFLYLRSVCLPRFIFQVIKKKQKQNNSVSASVLNSYNFAILRSVFSSRNVCVSNPKYIH